MSDKEESGELMYVKCSYCGAWIDTRPGQMNQISHSICPACFQAFADDKPEQTPSMHERDNDISHTKTRE